MKLIRITFIFVFWTITACRIIQDAKRIIRNAKRYPGSLTQTTFTNVHFHICQINIEYRKIWSMHFGNSFYFLHYVNSIEYLNCVNNWRRSLKRYFCSDKDKFWKKIEKVCECERDSIVNFWSEAICFNESHDDTPSSGFNITASDLLGELEN